MITFNEFDVLSAKELVLPLLKSHWEEVAAYKDKRPLDPNYDLYFQAAESGSLLAVVATDESEVIGYSVYLIVKELHYQTSTIAQNDIFYVKPEFRSRGVGAGLMAYSESLLKDKGVSVITMHMKTKNPFDSLCVGLGYANIERIYSKYIGD